MTLFAGFDPEPVEPMSPGRRLTARQHADITRGVHPLMHGPLHTDGSLTCGTCVHRINGGLRGSYPKCDLTTMSHSAASDVRAFWPACPKWEPVASDGTAR